MKRRWHLFRLFLPFFLLALLIFFLSQNNILTGVTGFFEQGTVPLQKMTFGMVHQESNTQTGVEKLKQENSDLLQKLSHQKDIEKENQALRDQFKTQEPSSKNLLPAQVIGIGEDQITIDKGSSDGLKSGDVVVVRNNLIGKIIKTSVHVSVVGLLSKKGITFTAMDQNSSALGVATGQSKYGLILDLVELSEKLAKKDLVITKGDVDEKGHGFPPGLVVGKIISVNKKTSSIFQSAEVESLVDFPKLEMVFVMVD